MAKRKTTNEPVSSENQSAANDPNPETVNTPGGETTENAPANDQDPTTEDLSEGSQQPDLRTRLLAELADVEADIHYLERRKLELHKELDAIIEESESPDDHLANTRNILTYIQNQNARRRGEEIPTSPIDKAMARRRGHGLNRPKFPVKG
jgi:hypothetical protein